MKKKLLNELKKEGFKDNNISINKDEGGSQIIISEYNKEIVIDILKNSDWYYLEIYNTKKDTFTYNKKRKSIKSVINYIYKHLE